MVQTKQQRRILACASMMAAFGVALGAFGAHGLRGLLSPEAMGWWQTGVQYQMWHAVGLVGLAAVARERMGVPAALLALGALIFAGSLYVMALSGLRWLGAVTPVGGALMIGGWLLVAWRMMAAD